MLDLRRVSVRNIFKTLEKYGRHIRGGPKFSPMSAISLGQTWIKCQQKILGVAQEFEIGSTSEHVRNSKNDSYYTYYYLLFGWRPPRNVHAYSKTSVDVVGSDP